MPDRFLVAPTDLLTSDAVSLFAADPILPAPPAGMEPIHDREYRVRAFRIDPTRVLIQGAIRDQKPPGLYLADDPEPLTVHHMQVSLTVDYPTLEISHVEIHFESHPRDECPTIRGHYDQLVGLSIARGFTHRVRELFGGPRGCTHTTALLQAMAPVAVQCFWSLRAANARAAGDPPPVLESRRDDQSWRGIVNTCHVWAEDGPAVAAILAGAPPEVPVFLRKRLEQRRS